jgi:hypothetical protein
VRLNCFLDLISQRCVHEEPAPNSASGLVDAEAAVQLQTAVELPLDLLERKGRRLRKMAT